MNASHPRARRAAVLVPVAALAFLVGCSSPSLSPATEPASPVQTSESSPAATTPTVVPVDATGFPDPCRLVTKEEAEATIGTVFPDPERLDNEEEQYFGIGRFCTYHPPQVYSGPKLDVRINMNPSDAVWAAFMADIGVILGGAEEVPNLGDKAYVFRKDHDCYVIKGKFVMKINLLYGMVTPLDVDERMINLCRTAAARIPA